jgi:hypothetical protein
MNATAVDVKEMLEYYSQLCDSSSADFVDLYPIHIGREPAEPVNTITIFETGVIPPQLTLGNEFYEYPTIQMRVRSTNYQEGWRVITLIRDLLHGRANETWNGVLYTLIRCFNGPAMLDFDKNQRVRFIINFNIQRR